METQNARNENIIYKFSNFIKKKFFHRNKREVTIYIGERKKLSIPYYISDAATSKLKKSDIEFFTDSTINVALYQLNYPPALKPKYIQFLVNKKYIITNLSLLVENDIHEENSYDILVYFEKGNVINWDIF